jgi:hypothetical protein
VKWLNKLKCKLGFHDFKFKEVDEQFMPKVRILLGQCSRCVEFHNYFMFLDSKKIVVRNSGFNRIFGEFTVMPLEVRGES